MICGQLLLPNFIAILKLYFYLHWHKLLDPIAMESRGIPGAFQLNNLRKVFEFYWSYLNILLLVASHFFCYFLNPICTSVVCWHLSRIFQIRILYFSSLIRYYILWKWFSIKLMIEPWLIRLWIRLFGWYCFDLFVYRFKVAAFTLLLYFSFSPVLLYPFLLTQSNWSNLILWPTFFNIAASHISIRPTCFGNCINIWLLNYSFPEWLFFLSVLYSITIE